MADAFQVAKQSIKWADEAISDLQSEVTAFFQAGVAEMVTDLNHETKENILKVRLKTGLPARFNRRATEALTTLRHAFDQAAFAARNQVTGPSSKSVYYPWAQTEVDLHHLLRNRGFDERLWVTFSSHEPYMRSDADARGDDLIRTLAQMANDKHTFGLAVNAHISRVNYPTIDAGPLESLEIVYPRWDAEKNEAEVIRWIGDVKVDTDCSIAFEVVFKHSRLPKAVNVLDALSVFSAKAKQVVETLDIRCRELRGEGQA